MGEPEKSFVSLWRDVAAWREFVEECKVGYMDSLAEYEFDLSVRDRLQRALDDVSFQRVKSGKEFQRFKETVAALDEEFSGLASMDRPVADADVLAWWHLRVPDKAGREFADELFQRLGVRIATVE
jgi:hypothetical protein